MLINGKKEKKRLRLCGGFSLLQQLVDLRFTHSDTHSNVSSHGRRTRWSNSTGGCETGVGPPNNRMEEELSHSRTVFFPFQCFNPNCATGPSTRVTNMLNMPNGYSQFIHSDFHSFSTIRGHKRRS